ncbi:MAG: immunoglobulin domain-containing protein [Opitutales bacterium]
MHTAPAQTWPADPVEVQHQGSSWWYWVPTDAPAGEPLRVIVNLPGAGGGLSRPSNLLDALTLRGHHAVVASASESYLSLIATDLVDFLRDDQGLNIKDEIFLTGFSRGGQMTSRIFQQLPAGIMGASPQNPGSVTLPSGKLYGSIDSNQGGWTDEEVGPRYNSSAPPWIGDETEVGLASPTVEAAKNIPVLNVMGVNDSSRYPATHFFNMEMQHTFGHPHFETLWSNNGHNVSDKNRLPMVDFLIRLEEHPDNTAPTAKIDGPRIVVLNPGTTHTLTATASDVEDDDATLTYEWRQASVEDHHSFRDNDTFSYVPRYIDGVDGYLAMHLNAPIQPDGLSDGSSNSFSPRKVIDNSLSYTFTTPTLDPNHNESTPIFLEFKAIDSAGFSQTDSVAIVVNGPPRILEGPTDRRSVLYETEQPLRYRALDITSDSLQWTVETAPDHGTLAWDSDSGEYAELRYTPDNGYLGPDSFVLQVTDELGLSSDLTVELTVSDSAMSIPAEMNALQQRSTDRAGSLTDGSTMELKTGPHPKWKDLRSAFVRFSLEGIAGDFVSAEARIHVNERNQTGADTVEVYVMDEATYGEVDGLAYGWGIAQPLPGSEAILSTLTVDETGSYTLDVTDAVQDALDANQRTVTLMYRSDSENGPVYASRHWTDPDLRPQLEVVSLVGDPEAPTFPQQPVNATVTDGDPASFSAEVFGIPLPEITWQKDGVDLVADERISGVNSPELLIDPARPSDAGDYRVKAVNTAGTGYSDAATLTVDLIAPTITVPPSDIASVIDRTETFTVEAEGSEPLSYSWSKDGSPIANADGPSLEVGPLGEDDIGTYSVTVTNDAGSTTASAELTVNLDGNFTYTYDLNGGSGSVPGGAEVADGSTVGVSFSPAPERDGFVFAGWKRDPALAFPEFHPDAAVEFVIDEPTTLYAHWALPWTPVEDFQDLTPGDLTGQNGWTGADSTQVVEDPTDASNQVMRFAPGSNDKAEKDLDPGIADSGVSTLYLRMYVPEGDRKVNQQLRLSDNGNLRLKIDSTFDDQPADTLLQRFYTGENDNQEIDPVVGRDQWVQLWIVFDYAQQRGEVYLQRESDDQPVFASVQEDMDPANYFFGEKAVSTLVFIGWDNGPVLWDDIHVLHGARQLGDPRLGEISVPTLDFSAWADSYADDLSEAEREPQANPAGDGIPNLLKYALGLDPRSVADRSALPQMSLEEDGGSTYLTLHVLHSPDTTGIDLEAQYSEDLINWSEGIENLEVLANDPDQLIVRSKHPIGGEKNRQFLRIQVEINE